MYSTFELPFSTESQHYIRSTLTSEDLPTNNSNGLGFVEARQVEEVGILVVLVEHGSRTKLEFIGCEDCDAASRELFCECCTAVMVFEG